ncbi:MAG: hypothetical protein AAF633_15485 [Chloroflexota bacterium]
MGFEKFRNLEINGGQVTPIPTKAGGIKLEIPPISESKLYTDAQIDDYGGLPRAQYPWHPRENETVDLRLTATFSHTVAHLIGTAGFGFWNAPFGDPTVPWPALPQAVWFFFGSPPNDLPLNPQGEGNRFFAGTLDAGTGRALALAPLAPFVVGLNHFSPFRQRVWPRIQSQLGISFASIGSNIDITQPHRYRLLWHQNGASFEIDGHEILVTEQSPRGPLGFVCWIDNQYMRVTPTGRLAVGTLKTQERQSLFIQDFSLKLFKNRV